MTAAAPAARVPGPAVPARGRPLLKAGRQLMRTVASVLLAAAVATFLFLAVGPSFLGYQTSIMLSGSMAPTSNGVLASIWRKGPDAADGAGNGADGAKTPAAG